MNFSRMALWNKKSEDFWILYSNYYLLLSSISKSTFLYLTVIKSFNQVFCFIAFCCKKETSFDFLCKWQKKNFVQWSSTFILMGRHQKKSTELVHMRQHLKPFTFCKCWCRSTKDEWRLPRRKDACYALKKYLAMFQRNPKEPYADLYLLMEHILEIKKKVPRLAQKKRAHSSGQCNSNRKTVPHRPYSLASCDYYLWIYMIYKNLLLLSIPKSKQMTWWKEIFINWRSYAGNWGLFWRLQRGLLLGRRQKKHC